MSDSEPKPNFFIVGAAKCGTTAWYWYLRDHRNIYFPDVKEPHFFCHDLPGYRQITDENRYRSLFSRAGSSKVIGEASVMYLYSEVAADEIHAFNPDAKILILLREQEDFLPALHHQLIYDFRETIEDFETAWRQSEHRSPEKIPGTFHEPKVLNYVALGRFHEQVKRYLDVFPADQVKVVRFRDWTADPRATYVSILDFLGVADDGRTDFPKINEAKAHRAKWLARMIMFRPRWMEAVMRPIRRLLGRNTLRIAGRTMKALAAKGYMSNLRPELRAEIRDRFAENNRQLDELLAASAAKVTQ